MIATITGKLSVKSPDAIIIDVNGVGYRILIPLSTYYQLPEVQGTVSIHTYLHVREDALVLFGFLTTEEKDFFQQLIGIDRVGPKLALNILSGIPLSDLREAILKKDVARIDLIPGIGRKSAERIILELKDKVMPFDAESRPGMFPDGEKDGVFGDVVSALLNLGYRESLAARAAKEAKKQLRDYDFESLFKSALKILAK